MSCNIFNRAADLPQDWDLLAKDNPYLTRDFLGFVEGTEQDYHPRYYLFYQEGQPDSCFVAFRRRGYNLGMFTRFNLRIPVTLIYLPMCVTRPGIVLGACKEEVLDTVRAIRGFKMILNLPGDRAPGFATGLTCPRCVLDIRWHSFDEYVAALRSDYRNRLRKTMKRSSCFTLRFIDNHTGFTEEMYTLYRNVLEGSRIRIETLSRAFFEGKMFRIFVLELEGRPVGFTQLLENGEELIFEFVGVDYNYNTDFAVYHRMLGEIIRYAIDHGFRTVDFGQTADDTKLKLGCRYEYLYAWLHHSNPLINAVCRKLAHRLEYRPLTQQFHVFRGEPS